MGTLRTEPKAKSFLSEREYSSFLDILKNAKRAANEHHVYWDLDGSDNASRTRKAFIHIAEKENIPVVVRRERGKRTLSFSFKEGLKQSSARMSAGECQNRIMGALQQAKRPLQKAEIINATGISPSTWNIRIKELMGDGKVLRQGDRRDTKYRLPG